VSRVEINADGRQVVVDADGTADDLAKVAISLWEHAESYRPVGPGDRVRLDGTPLVAADDADGGTGQPFTRCRVDRWVRADT